MQPGQGERSRAPKSRIVGTGHYVPTRVLTNHDLEKMVDTSDAWIVERTGIRERHIAAEGEASSDMAAEAAKRALAQAELDGTPVSLQQLIVHLTRNAQTTTADSPAITKEAQR